MNELQPELPVETCTGCEVCRSVCPVGAIRMEADPRGFLHPKVNLSHCIHCGLCEEKCPALEEEDKSPLPPDEPGVFASWSRRRPFVKRSSSGGIFTELALETFKMGGVVFGARWTNDMKLTHGYCESPDELVAFCGSKYVQSEIGDAYRQAKRFLDEERQVLFSGTPCQIAGLKNFLGKAYDNLLSIDLLCHGVPPQRLFQKYLGELEHRFHGRAANYQFRDKKHGWNFPSIKATFTSGKQYVSFVTNDLYYIGFVKNLFLRPCCYHCRYARPRRLGDITLADFWGYRPHRIRYWGFHFGCSCIIVNTEAGKRFFEQIRGRCVVDERSLSEAAKSNTTLNGPVVPHPDSEAFWNEYIKNERFGELCSRYCPPEHHHPYLFRLIILKTRYRFLFPNWLARCVRMFKR